MVDVLVGLLVYLSLLGLGYWVYRDRVRFNRKRDAETYRRWVQTLELGNPLLRLDNVTNIRRGTKAQGHFVGPGSDTRTREVMVFNQHLRAGEILVLSTEPSENYGVWFGKHTGTIDTIYIGADAQAVYDSSGYARHNPSIVQVFPAGTPHAVKRHANQMAEAA